MFRLENFSFNYHQESPLFEAVDLEIKLNEVTLLTGANGSGKSTLLRILSGLNKKYNGSIKLVNQSLREYNIRSLSEKLIYLKQEPQANIVSHNPQEDLHIWLAKYTSHKIDHKRILEALDRYQISELLETPVWKLSGGQAKRVGLAALNLYPEKYWILDEPSAGLDKELQSTLLEIIKLRKLQNLGTLIVSHRINLFQEITDKIYEIKDRKII